MIFKSNSLQNTLAILEKRVPIVAEGHRFGGDLIQLEESSQQSRAFFNICFFFSFIFSDINNPVFTYAMMRLSLSEVFDLGLPSRRGGTVPSEILIKSKENRGSSIFSVGPETSNNTTSELGHLESLHGLRATLDTKPRAALFGGP